ncbi:MAG: ABC transporter ATP-binding protein [Roseibacillus sp.]
MKTASKAHNKTSEIVLSSGLAIGYDQRLAEVGETISLGLGTHYLLGRNGRGKTTLFRTLCGMIKPLEGEYQVEGFCRFISEDLVFDQELKAPAILKSLLGKKKTVEALEFAQQIELDLSKPYGKLSTGNKRKVNLLLAEFGFRNDDQDIIFLDEPFTGLDAPTRQAFIDRWAQETSNVVRVVSAHPDFDEMPVPSALVISDGILNHQQSPDMSWGELRQFLN